MKITPTPFTAALAGLLSAGLWPLAWQRHGGGDAAFSMELVLATLLLVALPAHAFVVGFQHRSSGRAWDVPLLQRVGAWLLAAAVAVGVQRLL